MTPTEDLTAWLLDHGRMLPTVREVVGAFAQQLRRHAPVDRFWFGTKVLHPQAAAFFWVCEGDEVRESSMSYARFDHLAQRDSPILRLRHGAPETWFKVGSAPDMPDLEALFGRGYREQFALPVHFRGVWAGGLTFSTREAFTQEHVALFRGVMPVLTTVLEPRAADLVTYTLLRTYLGRNAGKRVFHGQVKRGDGETLRAVVWFSDVRGFTQLSESLPRDALLGLLNDAFERVVGVVEDHGGEVLKFMGDGVLAVFPSDGDDDGEAAHRALSAAQDLQVRLDARGGEPRIRMGVGLHLGEVSYGNIGSPGRLDFTVIGPAVNLAARVESQCSTLGEPVLASQDIAQLAFQSWREVARVAVKGVSEPVGLFAPKA
ncbi:MAG: adenylate/guanylate cyclase domain-containing protein [Myxococcota bacterium]|nr:adenylate/guanylate cyclase domain-containing protein [Myxococcota bacterium]